MIPAKEKGGFDQSHSQKWNMSMVRKVVDGETETVIYQVTSPVTATHPEGPITKSSRELCDSGVGDQPVAYLIVYRYCCISPSIS